MSRKSSPTHRYDVVVIGGGAAGMMAAGRAASRGRRVLLLEKNAVLGKKLGITGGGRCNITNAEFDTRTLLRAYGDREKFLHSPFSQFGVQDTFDFFAERGLPLVVHDRKRAFPHTLKAGDVVEVMKQYMKGAGVEVVCSQTVESLGVCTEGGFEVTLQNGVSYRAVSAIVASGGLSHAYTGSTGEAFRWLRALSYTVHEPTPDLVPLTVEDEWVRSLSGKTLKDVGIVFTDSNGKTFRKRGDVLATHFGISGPTIINSSAMVKQMLHAGSVNVSFNLFPGIESAVVDQQLLAYFSLHKNKTLRNGLREFLPAGTADVIVLQSGCQTDTKIHSVTRDERARIVRSMQGLTASVTGTEGFDRSIVSDGGVDLTHVDTRSMQSHLHPGLYFVGDVLHISRPSGGFSLQLCWTTGWVAGSHA